LAEHVCELKVRFGETDAAGVVYFANYFKWMEYATNELLNGMGLYIRDFMKRNVGFPVLEAHCTFKASATMEDRVTIRTAVEEMRTKTVRFSQRIYRGDTLLAEGYQVRIWVEFAEDGMKAASIPEEIRSKLSSLCG